ncbi:MAG: hypothetical protein ACR2GR_06250 [Rhodothermales bacterium]
MNISVQSDLPTIYTDINVFRYVAYGEMKIDKPECFRWVYSHVHLDEIHRSGNADALNGMEQLGAVKIEDILDEQFQSTGNVILRKYADPSHRYRQYLDAIAGYEDTGEIMIEILLRLYGADNFAELSLTPEKLQAEVDRLTAEADPSVRKELLSRANQVSLEMKEGIEKHMKEMRPLEHIRNEIGLSSGKRDTAARSDSPIDMLWEVIKDDFKEVEKDQFFGFQQIPGIGGVQHTQDGSIAGAYTILNLLGLRADRGLARREKVKNTISDSQHVGMASYCNALLSGDKRLCDKANAIYLHLGLPAEALHFKYEAGGFTVYLEVTKPIP